MPSATLNTLGREVIIHKMKYEELYTNWTKCQPKYLAEPHINRDYR